MSGSESITNPLANNGRRCRACHRAEAKERAAALIRMLRAELERDLEVFEGDGYSIQAGRVREALDRK